VIYVYSFKCRGFTKYHIMFFWNNHCLFITELVSLTHHDTYASIFSISFFHIFSFHAGRGCTSVFRFETNIMIKFCTGYVKIYSDWYLWSKSYDHLNRFVNYSSHSCLPLNNLAVAFAAATWKTCSCFCCISRSFLHRLTILRKSAK